MIRSYDTLSSPFVANEDTESKLVNSLKRQIKKVLLTDLISEIKCNWFSKTID